MSIVEPHEVTKSMTGEPIQQERKSYEQLEAEIHELRSEVRELRALVEELKQLHGQPETGGVPQRDITERKRLERELIQTEQLSAIGKLSAHVAHEIRNPLSSIRLNLELLRDECESGGEADLAESVALLDAIQAEVEVLTRFTDEYQQFARGSRLHRDRIDLGRLIEELADFLREEAGRRSISVGVELEPDVPEIDGDAAKLRQVLLNLGRNAIEAMGTGGRLELGLRRHEGSVEASVRDNGPGIAAQVLPRIFETFFTTKDRSPGLGLSLSQQIVREHGGSIECTSTPGHGATFTLRLPVAL